MSGDICRTKRVKVVIQENGIIRDFNGWSMGRLDGDYPFEAVIEEEEARNPKLRWHELPRQLGLLLAGALFIAFVLGVTLGHVDAMHKPCAAMCNVPESLRP